MKTYREHWLETEGQQYLARGLAEGKAETLVQILEHRFGGLSDAARARITQAPADELKAWTLRITDVKSPEALFNGDGSKASRH